MPSVQRRQPIRYIPAIPEPTDQPEDLLATIRALKIAVEFLSGQSAGGIGRVLTVDDVSTRSDTYQLVFDQINVPIDANFDAAETLFNDTITELQTSLTGAQDELQALLLSGEGSWLTADQALTVVIDSQAVSIAANSAAITTESVTRATQDSALAGQITTVTAQTAGNAAAITVETIARTNADSALAAQVTTVSAIAGRQRVFVQSTPPASPGPTADAIWIDTAHNNSLNTWNGTIWVVQDNLLLALNAAAISTETIARTTADASLAGQINTVVATAAGNAAAITTESAARASADTALSGTLTTVSARANMGSASGFIRLLATAATSTGVAAEYVVEVSANGTSFASAGFRLQALSNGTSRAVFEVTQFKVKQPGNNTDVSPFDIQGGLVIIREALIGVATIATAKIQDAAIVTAKIGDAAITTAKIGDLAVDTLKVAGNAITVPAINIRSDIAATTANISTVSAAFTGVAGSTITLMATFTGSQSFAAGNTGWNAVLYIDDGAGSYSQVAVAGGLTVEACITLAGARTLTASGSSQTVTAVLAYAPGTGVSISSRTLVLTVVKR